MSSYASHLVDLYRNFCRSVMSNFVSSFLTIQHGIRVVTSQSSDLAVSSFRSVFTNSVPPVCLAARWLRKRMNTLKCRKLLHTHFCWELRAVIVKEVLIVAGVLNQIIFLPFVFLLWRVLWFPFLRWHKGSLWLPWWPFSWWMSWGLNYVLVCRSVSIRSSSIVFQLHLRQNLNETLCSPFLLLSGLPPVRIVSDPKPVVKKPVRLVAPGNSCWAAS
jgi:hypothetical protein